MLEVGCGDGRLALALAEAGHEVVAIDPAAPDGPIFRRVRLEDFDGGPFDAAVASRSLHHLADLGAALDKIARLAPLLVLDEFAPDLLDRDTADWYERQRRVLQASGHEPQGPPASEWAAHHAGLHGYAELCAQFDRRFAERSFSREPYLYRYLGGVATEALERTLIEAGAIAALGYRYTGVRR